jgi:hypothetical protein
MGEGAGVGAEKFFCDETLVGENERTVSILGISSCSVEKKISNIFPGEVIHIVSFKESSLTGAVLLLSSVEEENTVAVVGEEAEGAFFKAGI